MDLLTHSPDKLSPGDKTMKYCRTKYLKSHKILTGASMTRRIVRLISDEEAMYTSASLKKQQKQFRNQAQEISG